MSERLHYFTEASTPVSFDCSDSDIDSDLDDLSKRPISESDRAKHHARQLQLWSDEARRRRSPAGVGAAPAMSPRRRPSTASMHDSLPPSLAQPPLPVPSLPDKVASPEMRTRLSADRQQSNLSERARLPNSRRVSRSHSAKNLRIRITPSSSSKSLLSDIESELGTSASAPQSPRVAPLADPRIPPVENSTNDKPTPPPGVPSARVRAGENKTRAQLTELPSVEAIERKLPTVLNLTPDPSNPDPNKSNNEKPGVSGSPRPSLGRRMSFSMRGKRLPSLKKFLRR